MKIASQFIRDYRTGGITHIPAQWSEDKPEGEEIKGDGTYRLSHMFLASLKHTSPAMRSAVDSIFGLSDQCETAWAAFCRALTDLAAERGERVVFEADGVIRVEPREASK